MRIYAAEIVLRFQMLEGAIKNYDTVVCLLKSIAFCLKVPVYMGKHAIYILAPA